MNWFPVAMLLSLALRLVRLMGAGMIGASCLAGRISIEEVRLPPLRVQGQATRAHTQGMELIDDQFFVTARREDGRPRRALLLRTSRGRTEWDVWDITPLDGQNQASDLDHPGGFQCDGSRLWIPIAQSRRHGRSLIKVFPLAEFRADHIPKCEFEIPVNDHIGALAVLTNRQWVIGANWDTESVLVWDFHGRQVRSLEGAKLQARGLGTATHAAGKGGLAVQDWKWVGRRLFASGLKSRVNSASRLCWYDDFLDAKFKRQCVTIPRQGGVELAREAMAIGAESVWFLPEDLGDSNRAFRIAFSDLRKLALEESANSPRE